MHLSPIVKIILNDNCLKHVNLFRTFCYPISTNNSKTVALKKAVSKHKSKNGLQLKVKQFPLLLKEIERQERRIMSAMETNVNESRVSDEIRDNNDLCDYDLKMLNMSRFNVLSPEFDESIVELEEESNEMNESNPTERFEQLANEYVISGKRGKSKHESNQSRQLQDAIKKAANNGKLLSLKFSLKSYINACIYADMLTRAHSVLLHYRSKTFKKAKRNDFEKNENPVDVSVYNVLLKGWARKAKTYRIKEIISLMKSANVKPNTESYAYYLLSFAQQSNPPSENEVSAIFHEMQSNNLMCERLFDNCYISIEERDKIMKLLNSFYPQFKPNPPQFSDGYKCNLLSSFGKIEQNIFNPSEGVNLENLDLWAKEQFTSEINGRVSVKSIVADEMTENKERLFYEKRWDETEKEWRSTLEECFIRHVKTLQIQSNEINDITIYPYLTVLDAHHYIDSLIDEMRLCVVMSDYYSPTMKILYSDLGRKIMVKYLIKSKIRDGTAQDFQDLYYKYLEYYRNPDLISKYSPREYWQKLMIDKKHFYNSDLKEKVWPFHVQLGVGYFLYNLILREGKINSNLLRANSTNKIKLPAFYTVYKCIGDRKYKKEIRTHPTLSKLFQKACLGNVFFDVTMLPMLCPPTPWISVNVGGYLLAETDFVRAYDSTRKWGFYDYDIQQLYPSFDSLNCVSLCPWIINKKVLDIAIHFFKNKGNLSLSIPIPESAFPPLPKIQANMSRLDKMKTYRQREIQKRDRAEMYSLWCDCLYKLSIAKHFYDKIFWFPNNMDFRGRVYPVPPHFNHLGNDLSRGILLFARGQPIGSKGLDWLKIHLINLTGLKKRSPISERLAYANEIMPLIIDSADNPLTGEKWWMTSEDPWQTLASCIEIVNVIRSPDPCSYISHFPVHQDGSCNGLQHYAALGRDQKGAESVNLHPADRPQDVYSDVAALVEKERESDAANGNQIAILLNGLISRKVVKQTVMTYVYGVTPYGSRLQILKRLKELEDFPKEQISSASSYIAQKTFLSIQEMFTATRCIQDWLTECAIVISKEFLKPVQWITPLGFPVVQPYHKSVAKLGETFYGVDNEINLRYITRSDIFQKPNTMKQKNAFPPNFIHSLDSSHMMLTAMHCHKAGITFASVHDCFWTHASCVEIMNIICRKQFVALHSEPILDDLSDYFVKYYRNIHIDPQFNTRLAMNILVKKLNKGSFDLTNVQKSVYFFS